MRPSPRVALAVLALALCTGCPGSQAGGDPLGLGDEYPRPLPLGGPLAVEGAGLLDPGFAQDGFSQHGHLSAESSRFDRFGGLLVGGRDEAGDAALLLRLTPAGAPDPGFGSGGAVRIEDGLAGGPAGPPGGLPSVRSILVDASDRVLLATASVVPGDGALTRARALVLRLEPDGTPDRGFGDAGRVVLAPGDATRSTTAIDLVEDGAGGAFVLALELEPHPNPLEEPTARAFVARLDATGALVQGFGIDGRADVPAGLPSPAAALVRDGLDRPVVAGERRGERARLALWRFTQDGSLDPSFGTGGEVLVDGAGESPAVDLRASDLALDETGGLVVAGQRLSDPRLSDDWPNTLLDYRDGQPFECSGAVWRFTDDGVLDTGFGVLGSTRLALSSGPYVGSGGGDRLDLCAGLALDAQGRILVALDSEPAEWADPYGWATFGPHHAALWRLLPDGSPDPTLGGAGAVVIGASTQPPAWPSALGRPRAVAVDGDGRVALVGATATDLGLVWCLDPSAGDS